MMTQHEDDIDDLIVEVDEGGRPTEYSAAVVEAICDNVAIGMTFKDSANLAGIKHKTAVWWLKVHPEFSASYARAKLKRKQRLVATVRKAAVDDWRAAMEMLARLHPTEWGKMQTALIAKQTDKAAELITMMFGEVTGDLDQDGMNDPIMPAQPVSEVPSSVLLLPAPSDVSARSDDHPAA